MKRIINGKRYDTTTATQIASASSDLPCNDFGYWEESLFRTPNGNWFLQGSGGPMTHYARACGLNSWSGGSDLRPISPDDAKAWLERHDHTDELEEHFKDALSDA